MFGENRSILTSRKFSAEQNLPKFTLKMRNRYNHADVEAVMCKKLKLIFTVLFLPAILGTFLTSCAAGSTLESTPAATGLESEEQAVYRALFDGLYGEAQMYVLMSETSTDVGGVENTDSTLDYVLPQMTGVDDETVASFRVRNDAAYPVPADMDLGLPYVLLTRDEKNEIFGVNTSGWDVFYTRYPNSPGLTTISRIGFNAAFTQALVYTGTQSHWLAGAGYYVLLEKTNGAWTIKQQIMTWIS
jgi:hypothetical protein